MRLLVCCSFLIASCLSQSCDDFQQETSCDLTDEATLVGVFSLPYTPQECQDLCRDFSHVDCTFFTSYPTGCYLLSACGLVEPCEGCMSGPVDPLLADCLTTAAPETTVAETTVAETTVAETTVAETTLAETTITTTMAETTTMVETTTMAETTTIVETTIAKCDAEYGVVCDDPENEIEHIEHISHASDCQAICQNHQECNFWSHYAEEGGEHWGHCLLFTDCARTTSEECHNEGHFECPPQPHPQEGHPIVQGNEPRPGPGGPKCHCVSGSNSPDLDECDDGTTGCTDDFYPGYLCDDGDLQEIEGISSASDCQAVCQNHNECEFFSYWSEEGPEHRGFCYLHMSCNELADEECREWDQCYCGPKYPDLDDCSFPELF